MMLLDGSFSKDVVLIEWNQKGYSGTRRGDPIPVQPAFLSICLK